MRILSPMVPTGGGCVAIDIPTEWIWAHPLPIAWPRGLDPDPPSGSAHPAFEPAPKLHQLAVVPGELRQCFWADDSHVAAGVAAKPDVVAFDHGVAKGFWRPVTEFGREPGERDACFGRLDP